jgi:hypothetical protein
MYNESNVTIWQSIFFFNLKYFELQLLISNININTNSLMSKPILIYIYQGSNWYPFNTYLDESKCVQNRRLSIMEIFYRD